MSNIIKFPKVGNSPPEPAPDPVSVESAVPGATAPGLRRFWSGLVKFVWVATVLVWPVLKWAVSIYVFFLFVRMFYYWNTPDVHAGWEFLAGFSALTAITYFVSIYKPKGALRESVF